MIFIHFFCRCIYVILTSLFELLWIFGLNVANSWWHRIIIVILLGLDLKFLAIACKTLPTGTVYAVFGTIGTTFMDAFIFKEAINLLKLFFIFILVVGVMGLNIADTIAERKEKAKLMLKTGEEG